MRRLPPPKRTRTLDRAGALPLVCLLLAGCTSSYSVSTLEVLRHRTELVQNGRADVTDQSGDTRSLSIDDETEDQDSVRSLLHGCDHAGPPRWRPAHAAPAPHTSCALEHDHHPLSFERTEWVPTIIGIVLSVTVTGTLIGCTAACDDRGLRTASAVTLFAVPAVAIIPVWLVFGGLFGGGQ